MSQRLRHDLCVALLGMLALHLAWVAIHKHDAERAAGAGATPAAWAVGKYLSSRKRVPWFIFGEAEKLGESFMDLTAIKTTVGSGIATFAATATSHLPAAIQADAQAIAQPLANIVVDAIAAGVEAEYAKMTATELAAKLPAVAAAVKA